jgi:CheY-like chemotaxis protein
MPSQPDANPSTGSSQRGEAGPRARLLLVDDEAMVVRVIARLLERSGFDVTVYTNPAEALSRLQAEPQAFDVLLTDMTMPEMTGIELARGASAAGATLPVVLLSGWIDNEAERLARAAGIARVLSKPIQVAALVAAVRAVVPATRH